MVEPIYAICKEDTGRALSEYVGVPQLSRSEVLTEIWKDTRVRAACFPVKPSIKVTHEKLHILPAIYDATTCEVTCEDTLVAGKRLIDAGLNPLILNFADDLEAGGVVDTGNSAQEESLWRRTNLCITQFQDFYPLLDPCGFKMSIFDGKNLKVFTTNSPFFITQGQQDRAHL